MTIKTHHWQYTCKICGSIDTRPIAEFMKRHAHGMTAELIPECELVKHRDGRSVTINLPPEQTWFLADTENGDKTRRKIRIWITGYDYGY